MVEVMLKSFSDTLSPKLEVRRLADDKLFNMSSFPNYSIDILHFVANPSVDEHIRQCAAVNLNYHLETRWKPSSRNPIPEAEKDSFKLDLVGLILASITPEEVQVHLAETLHVISKFDFPSSWPDLVPFLNSSLKHALKVNNFRSVNSILVTVNSLFKKYSYELPTHDVMRDFQVCLDKFAPTLLTTAESLSKNSDNATVPYVIKAQTLCCRIFYSLNHLALPRVFKNDADKWIILFKNYLTNTDTDLAVVDDLRAAACDNITLFMATDERLLQNYMSDLLDAVRNLLVGLSESESPRRTPLTVAAFRFLQFFNRSPRLRVSISTDESLQQIIHNFVFPNVMVRLEDEHLFNSNYAEFINTEFDLCSRRTIACKLLKEIARKHKEEVTAKVLAQIRKSLDLFAENSNDSWKHLDWVIYLLSSVATTSDFSNVVDVQHFFTSSIVPQLRANNVSEFPMLKASALKFLTTFRDRIPKPTVMNCLDDVVRFLNSDVNVVHSYAATCIEKLLFVKDNESARYTSLDIAENLPVLITSLFDSLEKPESEENEYVMRCIVRVLQVADITPQVASLCIDRLPTLLDRARYKNPKSSTFNRFLFMAISTLVPKACDKNQNLFPAFEQCLLPSLQIVLSAENGTELVPYALQLFDQLVDLSRTTFTSHYMLIFDNILRSRDLLKNSANVPTLLHLFLSFLLQAPPNELNREGRLSHVLTVFDYLVSSPRSVEQGFYILKPIVRNLGYDVIEQHMNRIWASLYNLLQSSLDPTLVTSLIEFMSIFLVKHGTQKLVDSMTSVQPDIFLAFLGEYWIPNLMTITGYTEVKLSAVVSSMLLCESDALLDPAAEELWGKLLDGIVSLLSQPDCQEPAAACLDNAEDPLNHITDPKCHLVTLLANLSSQFCGRFQPIVTKYLSPANQTTLLQLCDSYKQVIV